MPNSIQMQTRAAYINDWDPYAMQLTDQQLNSKSRKYNH